MRAAAGRGHIKSSTSPSVYHSLPCFYPSVSSGFIFVDTFTMNMAKYIITSSVKGDLHSITTRAAFITVSKNLKDVFCEP